MNKSDISRNLYMLRGASIRHGYDWWWHNFTGTDKLTGERKAFYVEFYIINPELSPEKVVLGQNEVNQAKGLLPSYAMLNVGTWGKVHKQLHAYYPLNECSICHDRLDISFGSNHLSENRMSGSVEVTREQADDIGYMSDEGTMSFDLSIHKRTAFNVGYGASRFFRFLNAFEMFWHAEGMKTEYEGTVIFDGREYIVDPSTSFGYADKNWGRDYTSPWVWFSSCNMYSRKYKVRLNNSVFDIGGGRPKVLGIALNRKLLIDLNYEGRDYEYNFSKFWTGSRIKFDCYETDDEVVWKIQAGNFKSHMDFIGRCKKSEMLLINYEAPDGVKRHNRLWNGGTGYGKLKLYDIHNKLIDEIVFKNAGCEYGEYDENQI